MRAETSDPYNYNSSTQVSQNCYNALILLFFNRDSNTCITYKLIVIQLIKGSRSEISDLRAEISDPYKLCWLNYK